jgi:deoxycytidylate deaminase
MIINAGAVKVIFRDGYSDELSEEMLQEAGVEVCKI